MKEILQTSKKTFIIMSVCGLGLIVIPFLWNSYQEQQQKAQARETYKQVCSFYEEVVRKIKAGEKLKDADIDAARELRPLCDLLKPD